MSLPKDHRFIALFRKCNFKTLPTLSPEAKMAKEEFSAFLNTLFTQSSSDDMLCRVEEVRLRIVNKMERRDRLMKLHAHDHLDNLSQIVQQMYIELQAMVKVEQQFKGKIKLFA